MPTSGTPTNTTILDDTISYIPYISQVPSTYPILFQCPMNARRNIYVVSIENDEPSLASYAVQMIQGKQKLSIY